MFKESDIHRQLDLFSTPETYLGSRASKKYLDPQAWHNMFYSHVTSKIDENIFRVLFPQGKKSGRPVASIRVLVAMSVLKEGFGCSDEDLFEKCEFDMLARRALGLVLLDDVMPSLDTYYLFRRRICEHYSQTGEDLLMKCFEQVTGSQVKDLKISGKCVRMDSKLIGSNIANTSRYELIHRTLTVYLKSISLDLLVDDMRSKAESYLGEDSSKTVYRSDKDTLNNRLQEIGDYIYSILQSQPHDSGRHALLNRVFNDQYVVTDSIVRLRDRKDVSSNSLQSPYDEDASFRVKNEKKTLGYVTNITETVEEGKPSIITSVQTETATFADCSFLTEAVENSERVTCASIDEIFADGAYQSPVNRKSAEDKGISLLTGKMQGGCRFILKLTEGTDELIVTDTTTGDVINAAYVGRTEKHGRRWRIPLNDVSPKYPWRYFTEKEVENSVLRQKILSQDASVLTKRNNVEAAMFQYSFHTRNGKTRYRGLLKHRMHAYNRTMWMNLKRIVIYLCSSLISEILLIFRAFLHKIRQLDKKVTTMKVFSKDNIFGGEIDGISVAWV